MNGNGSVEAQKRLLESKRFNEYEKKRAKIRELKKAWKEQNTVEK